MTKVLLYGRFISAPGPEELLIKEGALLVSSDDGHGIIEKVNWDVRDVKDAMEGFGVKDGDVKVYETGAEGFWFPGFIGEFNLSIDLDFV